VTAARSADGTAIAHTRIGSGPPVILVDGALCRRAFGPATKLAAALAPQFTVFTYDRRGRGDSGDTQPYAPEREVEDLAAIAVVAGEPVRVYGCSSGAALAIRAAPTLPLVALALYEPPLILPDSPPPLPVDRQAEICDAVGAGDVSGAAKLFFRMVGVPAVGMVAMRIIPGLWRKLTADAHTLPHDFAVLGGSAAGKPMPPAIAAAVAAIDVPTVVAVGGKSPPYMHHIAAHLARAIRNATLRELPGQTHAVTAPAIAKVLREHFATA
jgi:pimeloyl-ACP methyl ester carboxylesterase